MDDNSGNGRPSQSKRRRLVERGDTAVWVDYVPVPPGLSLSCPQPPMFGDGQRLPDTLPDGRDLEPLDRAGLIVARREATQPTTNCERTIR